MPDLKTTQEAHRSPITGTELLRLATSGANWQITLLELKSYVLGLTAGVRITEAGATRVTQAGDTRITH